MSTEKPSTLEQARSLLTEHAPASDATSQRLHREALYKLRLLMHHESALSGHMPAPACVDLSRAEEASVRAHDVYYPVWSSETETSHKRVTAAVLTHHGMSRSEISVRMDMPEDRVAWAVKAADPVRLRMALAIMEGTSNG